jgi:hypothetical protein
MVSGVKPPDPTQLSEGCRAQLTTDSRWQRRVAVRRERDVLGRVFDVSGLPGLTSKPNPTGKDILQAFLTAGQSDDPAVRNLVASIEYALYQSNYYSSQAAPNLYEVTGHDAEALGRACRICRMSGRWVRLRRQREADVVVAVPHVAGGDREGDGDSYAEPCRRGRRV